MAGAPEGFSLCLSPGRRRLGHKHVPCIIASEPPKVEPRWKRLGVWLAGGSSLLYLASRFLPCTQPAWQGEIEDSYLQVLNTAFAGGWQFGRDLVFTYGPWGFLYAGHHPATHTLAAFAWLGLTLAFWVALWRAARRLWNNALIAWLWLMVVAAVSGLPIFVTRLDIGFKGFIVLLWLYAFFLDDRRPSVPQVALGICLGLLSLVKFSVLVDSTVIVALISLDAVVRHRRFPWISLVFAASVLLFWMAARQHLSCLGPYLRYSWLLTGGFSESMMLTGPKETGDICLFLAVAVLPCGVAGWFTWTQRRCFALFPLGGLAFLLFTAFKYGYVRHDGHELVAISQLLLLSLALPAVAVATGRQDSSRDNMAPAASLFPEQASPWLPRRGLLSLAPSLFALLLAASISSRYYRGGLLIPFLSTLAPRQLAAPARLLRGAAAARTDYENYLAGIRGGQSVGPFAGTVDTYPGNAAALLAQGLPYRPRPVMQSYQAYAPEFAELNASFLRGPRAPDNILFQLFPIDDHFPALDDGLSWPELLARYDVLQVTWSGVELRRSPVPRPWDLTPLMDLPVPLGQVVALPAVTDAVLWAKLDSPLTLTGIATTALFKPPILWLTVWTQEGRELRFRLVPGLARGGFVLSPLVQDCVSFGLLASEGGLRELNDHRVAALRLSADTGTGLTSSYESSARLQLFRLAYPGQDLGVVAGFRELTSLWRVIRRMVWLDADYQPQSVSLPGIGSVLRVAPRSAMQLSLEGPSPRLRLTFGVLARGPGDSQAVSPIVFRVSALAEDGGRVELWSRQLDPSAKASDQNKQQAVIDMHEANWSNLILETVPVRPEPGVGLLCYWGQIEAESQ